MYEYARRELRSAGLTGADAEAVLRAAEALILGWSALAAQQTPDGREQDWLAFERCYRTMIEALIVRLGGPGAR